MWIIQYADTVQIYSKIISYNVCKASRKWHTSKSQPPFTCWLRCVKFWFQNTVCWGSPPSTRNLCRSTRAVWSGDPLWPTRPREPLHHCLKRNGIREEKGSLHVVSSHDSAIGCRREVVNVFWIQDPPFPKRSQVGIHVVLPQGSIASFQNFWNQSKFMKIGREIHSQSRIKALRVRMRQLISPLIVISTWVGRSQHVTSLVKLVDELHEDNRRRHLPSSIVENGVDIALSVTHQRDMKSTGCWRILRHQQQCQEQGAVELQGRDSLLRVILFESPRMVFLANFVLEPQYLVLRRFRTVCEPSSYPGVPCFLRTSITSTCPWRPWWKGWHLRELFGEKLGKQNC